MSIENRAELLSNRRDAVRTRLERASTLRQDCTPHPFDITINDLSYSGCKISGRVSLAVGDEVSVGLPGIRGCTAHVVWVKDGSNGVAFLQPLTEDDVDTVQRAQTLVDGHFRWTLRTVPFDQTMKPPRLIVTPLMDSGPYIHSGRRRITVIVGATISFWSTALFAVWALAHLG